MVCVRSLHFRPFCWLIIELVDWSVRHSKRRFVDHRRSHQATPCFPHIITNFNCNICPSKHFAWYVCCSIDWYCVRSFVFSLVVVCFWRLLCKTVHPIEASVSSTSAFPCCLSNCFAPRVVVYRWAFLHQSQVQCMSISLLVKLFKASFWSGPSFF